jgi:hypothetical protein
MNLNQWREKMSVLDTLNLVEDVKPRSLPVIQIRRNKLSAKLWEQIMLAKGQVEGKPFQLTKFRSFTDKQTGERKQLEVPKRIKPWWFVGESGNVCVSIKYGSTTLEIVKGKPSIQVENSGELIEVLSNVKTAVEAGELDEQIQLASASLKSGFKALKMKG